MPCNRRLLRFEVRVTTVTRPRRPDTVKQIQNDALETAAYGRCDQLLDRRERAQS